MIDRASYATPALASNTASRCSGGKSSIAEYADKIPGWDNGQIAHPNGNGGVITSQSLDWNSGGSALDLAQAYKQYLAADTRDVPGTAGGDQGLVGRVGWDFGHVESSIDNVYQIDEVLDAGTMMTVTLTWFRDRDFDANLFAIDEVAQADLDLAVRDTLTGDLISQSFSGVNNVEHLHFTLPRTSQYQIEVNFFGAVFDFSGTMTGEDYGLAWAVVPEPKGECLILAISMIGAVVGRDKSARKS